MMARLKNPKTMMRIGMALLVLAFLSNRFIPPTARIGPDLRDGLLGFLVGLLIGMVGCALRPSIRERGV